MNRVMVVGPRMSVDGNTNKRVVMRSSVDQVGQRSEQIPKMSMGETSVKSPDT